MHALEPEVANAAWEAVKALIPPFTLLDSSGV